MTLTFKLLTRLSASLALLTLLVFPSAFAAQFTKQTKPFPVVVAGDTLSLPFTGGLDEPKPTFIDFDRDSLIDLMIGERTGKLAWYRNIGTTSVPDWEGVTERLGGVDIGLWHVLCDIDADGDYDLFCDSRHLTVAFYRNESIGDSISFSLVTDNLDDLPAVNNTTPTFADIDGDNDLDFFLGGLNGTLNFYRNEGDSANPIFEFVTEAYDSILAFPGQIGGTVAGTNHGFSTIEFSDIDSDSDMDLFWGDLNSLSLYFFANLGDSVTSDLLLQSEDFLPKETFGFNHVDFADIDHDSDLDMIVGINNGAFVDNLSFYRNEGTPQSWLFIEESLNYLPSLDLGSTTAPTLGDIDADDDLDLLVGSGNGRIAFFENQGDKFSPIFVLIDEFYKAITVGSNASPKLYDWDNDGDLDLLIGTGLGRIEYWRNEGDSSFFDPVKIDNQLAGIKVDNLATPVIADFNDDGLPDLLVGEWDFNTSANMRLYENIGTLSVPSLQLVSNKIIKATVQSQTIPTPYDWNNDGRIDLLVGNNVTGVTLFMNYSDSGSFPDSTTLYPLPTLVPGNDDGNQVVIALADIDADGDPDFFTGEEFGGLNFHLNEGECCTGTTGNVNLSPDETPSVSDLGMLMDHLFIGGAPLACPLEADVTGDSPTEVTMADLTLLVDYLFISGAPLSPCP